MRNYSTMRALALLGLTLPLAVIHAQDGFGNTPIHTYADMKKALAPERPVYATFDFNRCQQTLGTPGELNLAQTDPAAKHRIEKVPRELQEHRPIDYDYLEVSLGTLPAAYITKTIAAISSFDPSGMKVVITTYRKDYLSNSFMPVASATCDTSNGSAKFTW